MSKIMQILTTPMVGPGLAGCCTFVSIFGVLILSVLGRAFESNAEVLMGHTDDPEDGKAVARTLYGAAIVYAVFVVFCGCQLGAARRSPRGAVQLR